MTSQPGKQTMTSKYCPTISQEVKIIRQWKLDQIINVT